MRRSLRPPRPTRIGPSLCCGALGLDGAGHRMDHPPLRLECDPVRVLDFFLCVSRSGARAVRQVERDRVLHQCPLAADLGGSSGVRHPGAVGGHAGRYRPGDAHCRAAGTGRRGVHLRILHRQGQGNTQDSHRAAGGRSLDRMGIRRLHGAGAADYPNHRGRGGRESAQRRRDFGPDERADHRFGRRGRR